MSFATNLMYYWFGKPDHANYNIAEAPQQADNMWIDSIADNHVGTPIPRGWERLYGYLNTYEQTNYIRSPLDAIRCPFKYDYYYGNRSYNINYFNSNVSRYRETIFKEFPTTDFYFVSTPGVNNYDAILSFSEITINETQPSTPQVKINLSTVSDIPPDYYFYPDQNPAIGIILIAKKKTLGDNIVEVAIKDDGVNLTTLKVNSKNGFDYSYYEFPGFVDETQYKLTCVRISGNVSDGDVRCVLVRMIRDGFYGKKQELPEGYVEVPLYQTPHNIKAISPDITYNNISPGKQSLIKLNYRQNACMDHTVGGQVVNETTYNALNLTGYLHPLDAFEPNLPYTFTHCLSGGDLVHYFSLDGQVLNCRGTTYDQMLFNERGGYPDVKHRWYSFEDFRHPGSYKWSTNGWDAVPIAYDENTIMGNIKTVSIPSPDGDPPVKSYDLPMDIPGMPTSETWHGGSVTNREAWSPNGDGIPTWYSWWVWRNPYYDAPIPFSVKIWEKDSTEYEYLKGGYHPSQIIKIRPTIYHIDPVDSETGVRVNFDAAPHNVLLSGHNWTTYHKLNCHFKWKKQKKCMYRVNSSGLLYNDTAPNPTIDFCTGSNSGQYRVMWAGSGEKSKLKKEDYESVALWRDAVAAEDTAIREAIYETPYPALDEIKLTNYSRDFTLTPVSVDRTPYLITTGSNTVPTQYVTHPSNPTYKLYQPRWARLTADIDATYTLKHKIVQQSSAARIHLITTPCKTRCYFDQDELGSTLNVLGSRLFDYKGFNTRTFISNNIVVHKDTINDEDGEYPEKVIADSSWNFTPLEFHLIPFRKDNWKDTPWEGQNGKLAYCTQAVYSGSFTDKQWNFIDVYEDLIFYGVENKRNNSGYIVSVGMCKIKRKKTITEQGEEKVVDNVCQYEKITALPIPEVEKQFTLKAGESVEFIVASENGSAYNAGNQTNHDRHWALWNTDGAWTINVTKVPTPPPPTL